MFDAKQHQSRHGTARSPGLTQYSSVFNAKKQTERRRARCLALKHTLWKSYTKQLQYSRPANRLCSGHTVSTLARDATKAGYKCFSNFALGLAVHQSEM